MIARIHLQAVDAFLTVKETLKVLTNGQADFATRLHNSGQVAKAHFLPEEESNGQGDLGTAAPWSSRSAVALDYIASAYIPYFRYTLKQSNAVS